MYGERESNVEYMAELVVVCCLGILEGFALGRLNASCSEHVYYVAICATHR